MAWQGSSPHRTRGRTWQQTRQRILRRDGGVCHVCHRPGAGEVDHVIALAHGGTDADDNLAAIHRTPCHTAKTQHEATARRVPQRRPAEPHPGLRS